MQIAGRATLHLRAESWECDFNGHWNTRFYCRGFRWARQRVALEARDGVALAPVRLLRFHREMRSGDVAVIRSFAAPRCEGIAHVMFREGEAVATALETGWNADHLPTLPEELVEITRPRGLPGRGGTPAVAQNADAVAELGPVGADEIDAQGRFHLEAAVARLAVGALHHEAGLGYSQRFTLESGLGRMLVELRHMPLGRCRTDSFLRQRSRIVEVGDKTWVSQHILTTLDDEPVAAFEKCMVAVDMARRRATAVPAFMRAGRAQAVPPEPDER